MSEKEFAKYKLTVVNSQSIVAELEDDEAILADRDWNLESLGLDHVDKSAKAADRLAHLEKSIKIHNVSIKGNVGVVLM